MADFEKVTLDALVAALSDGADGFNSKLSSLAMSYGFQPFYLEFGTGSKNVIYGYLDDQEVDVSQIFEYPGLIVYSTEVIDEHKRVGFTFSGFMNQILDFYLRYRSLDDPDLSVNQPDFGNNYEKYPQAVTAAAHAALRAGRGAMQQSGVQYINFRADRGPVQNFGDGHVQKLTITLGFEVHIQ